MNKWATSIVIASTLTLAWVLHAQEGYKIVVNAGNPSASLSKAQVSKFFLEKATWDDGQAVAAVDLPPTSPVRELFSREILSMPISSVSARWRDNAGLGRGEPPPAMAGDREVLAYVRLKPGGIGYVSAGTDTQGVKVISVGRADTTTSSREPLEVGGPIPMPERITVVQPTYPPSAKIAHIQGEVEIELVIGTSGDVERTRVVRSVPTLDAAAVAAVRQWKYRPTVVNGVPVPLKARVRITFTL